MHRLDNVIHNGDSISIVVVGGFLFPPNFHLVSLGLGVQGNHTCARSLPCHSHSAATLAFWPSLAMKDAKTVAEKLCKLL